MKFHRSMAGLLTLWYAGVFGLCFLAVFGTFYGLMSYHFHRWTDAQLEDDFSEVHMEYAEGGIEGARRQLQKEEASGDGRFFGRIADSKGTIVYEIGSVNLLQVPFSYIGKAKSPADHKYPEEFDLGDGPPVRVTYGLLSDGSVFQVGLRVLDHEVWMRQFSRDLLKVAVLALLLAVCAGNFMARRALSPIRKMTQAASEITGRPMGRRVPFSGSGTEVDQLAVSFNGMLDRIDTLVEGLRNATEGLTHDLRTPITGIRGMVEVTLSSRRGPDEYQIALYKVIEQLDRLLDLIDTTFDAAEAESGALALRLEQVSIDEIARDIVQSFEPVALSRGILLKASVSSETTLEGDRARLSQMLANLVDNALKYTPSGGRIDLSVSRDREQNGVLLTVSDTGTGISEKDMPHIFERYYRGNSRSGEGIGLGLPITHGIVKAHNGDITVASSPGEGTVFRVFFPL